MKVVNYPNKLFNENSSLVLGAFASIHNGHLKLINESKSFKLKSIVLLIENADSLPSKLKKEFEPLNIRLQKLANLGVDGVIVLKFNDRIKNTLGKDFATILKLKYKVENFIVGKDFKMGRFGLYTAKNLKADFTTTIVDYEKINDAKISTSLMREIIELGDVEIIRKLSPFNYFMNIEINQNMDVKILSKLKPHNGLYACWLQLGKYKYASTLLINNDKNKIIVENITLENKLIKTVIEMVSKIRVITNIGHANILSDDIKKTNQILGKYKN